MIHSKGELLWQKDRMVTHILFDLCLFKHFSPVANFGDQSLYRLGDSGFFRHQCIVKATVSWVFQDLKFKISEGSDQN